MKYLKPYKIFESSDPVSDILAYLSEKINVKINKESLLGSGVYGEVYDLGNGKVIKITDTHNSESQERILNKDIPGIVKVTDIGKIEVQQEFLSKKYSIPSLNLLETNVIAYDNFIGYVIMEKLDIEEAKLELSQLEGAVNEWSDNTYCNIPRGEIGLYLLNSIKDDEEFLNDFKDFTNNRYDRILQELIDVLNVVRKYYSFKDVHPDQFGRDANWNLKAFDLSDAH